MNSPLWPIIKHAILHPTRAAIIDDTRTWRHIDLLGGALHLAKQLESQTDAQNIGVMLPTSGAFPMTMLAAWLLNRTIVPINYLLTDAERQFIIDDSEIDTIVTATAMLDFLDTPPRNVTLIKLDKAKFKGIPPLRIPPRPAPDQIATILYTSGTSGKPKGVLLTHHNLASNVQEIASIVNNLKNLKTFMGVLPQFHSFGLTGLTLLPLTHGAKVIYTARFNPKKIIELFKEHSPSVFLGIPSMYNALLTVKSAKSEDLQSLIFAISGGEPLPKDVASRFKEKFDVDIREGYGLTETAPVASLNSFKNFKPGSVGQPLPSCKIKILDEDNNPLPVNEEGEILITGPNIMQGYFKQPDLTEQVIDSEGYFRSGDWGKIDDEGYLHITGRKKEMLIIAGENVFPREIEEALNQHPDVSASAVIGKQDPMRGELPVAFVELNEDAPPLDEAALRAFCRDKLATYKVPRQIIQLDALPRNPTGKINRRDLPKP